MATLDKYRENLDYVRQLYTIMADDYTKRKEGKKSTYTLEVLSKSALGLGEVKDNLRAIYEIMKKDQAPSEPQTVQPSPSPVILKFFFPSNKRESDFRITEEVIGSGGFGIINITCLKTSPSKEGDNCKYIAKIIPFYLSENLPEQVALQLEDNAKATVEEKRFNVEKEVMIHQVLANSGLAPKIYEVYMTDTHAVIIMDKWDGNLEQLSKDSRYLNLENAIIDRIIDLVNRMHDLRIVHEDLKPANILYRWIGNNLELTLTDFGIAKVGATEADIENENSYFSEMIAKIREDNEIARQAAVPRAG